MDTEDGVEVVWNEVLFSEPIRELIQIFKVKFHQENASSHASPGNFEPFCHGKCSPAYKNKKKCHQTANTGMEKMVYSDFICIKLFAFLFSPIIHGNLTCDTIFIQHNGLIKIGSVAPEAINHHVKTCQRDMRNMHFIAPEYGSNAFSTVTPAVDIYAFGMCALEMAALEITANGESTHISEDVISKTIDSLENALQKDFITKCLERNPLKRASARELLFHPVIFEVHSLKLLCAHVIVNSALYQPDQLTDEALRARYFNQSDNLAFVPYKGGVPGASISRTATKQVEVEKFLDDTRNGIYPLFACAAICCPVIQENLTSPEMSSVEKSNSSEAYELETRRIINIMCNIKPQEDSQNFMMTVLLRMDDKMNRQLSCEVSEKDTPIELAEELVYNGFINEADRDMVATLISDTLSRRHIPELPVMVPNDTT
ncbi:nuclear receptor-binding protein [Caerostris extrusa]|uniref:Nuclear receptor-binding protein n=1 Tax=Caerostris extrusa TaxID=172846 RepID=A0AAV4Q0H2_CAEEX|nr:nuclear receptor-binding protein [Caerostris extrusa]